jgi:hypothetical protein
VVLVLALAVVVQRCFLGFVLLVEPFLVV